MTDELLEELVIRRIREQLGSGGLERFIEANLRVEATPSASVVVQPGAAHITLRGGTPEVKIEAAQPGDAIAVIESVFPDLANDMQGCSPQDVTLAINLYLAIIATLQFLLMIYQTVHQQPPTHEEFIEIFNHTTNVIQQTTTTITNMPPPSHIVGRP
jgi:hypothetical protein